MQYLGELGTEITGSGAEAASLRLNPSKPKGGTSLVTFEVVFLAAAAAAAAAVVVVVIVGSAVAAGTLSEMPFNFSTRSKAHSAILVNFVDNTLSSEKQNLK